MMQERSPSLPKLDTETLTSSEDLSVSGKEFTRCNKGICVMYRAGGLYWENCALGLEFVLQTEDDCQRKIIWFA